MADGSAGHRQESDRPSESNSHRPPPATPNSDENLDSDADWEIEEADLLPDVYVSPSKYDPSLGSILPSTATLDIVAIPTISSSPLHTQIL
ncbi:hypothetical protein MMC28_005496 [Mycoblastus sanguinarius]|nr:hypothetical protein [Mycoblastus sanguinarius]